MDYVVVKAVHVSCVAASYVLFVMRGWWMLQESSRLQQRWVRVLPHGIDTLLLASAITMAVASRQYPFVAGWLTAKVLALPVYIGLGAIALRSGRTRGERMAAWLAAQAMFAYIVMVALTRNPLPWTAY